MLPRIATTISRSMLASLTLAALLTGCATRSSQTASDSAPEDPEKIDPHGVWSDGGTITASPGRRA